VAEAVVVVEQVLFGLAKMLGNFVAHGCHIELPILYFSCTYIRAAVWMLNESRPDLRPMDYLVEACKTR